MIQTIGILKRSNTNSKTKKIMKTGVIVARMQSPYLTDGHRSLISFVASKCDAIVIVLGVSQAQFTDRNPLTFQMRRAMILNSYPYMQIEKIYDHPSDEQWSKNLDDLIAKYESPTLFGSRDSFLSSYTGVFPIHRFEPIYDVSSSKIRKGIKEIFAIDFNKQMRIGLIYGIESRFPIVYSTVDVAIIGENQNMLLVRKPGEKEYRFLGGFVDTSDKNYMHAAFRELNEEISNLENSDIIVPLKYIDSFKIDDYRYRGTKDSIMTNFFTIMVKDKNNPEDKEFKKYNGGDDVEEETKWFDIESFDISQLSQAHHILYEALKKYLYA